MINKKGFTLVEVITVIVILGALLIIAIPQITKHLATARRELIAEEARKLVEGVKQQVAEGDFKMYRYDDGKFYIPYKCLNMEEVKANRFKWEFAFIILQKTGNIINYSFYGAKEGNLGFLDIDYESLIESNVTTTSKKALLSTDYVFVKNDTDKKCDKIIRGNVYEFD